LRLQNLLNYFVKHQKVKKSQINSKNSRKIVIESIKLEKVEKADFKIAQNSSKLRKTCLKCHEPFHVKVEKVNRIFSQP